MARPHPRRTDLRDRGVRLGRCACAGDRAITSLPTKALPLDANGRVRVNQANPAVKHAQISVGASEVELTAGLANRRRLLIKPVRTGETARRFILIGPSGFDTDMGTPVWEEYELILDIGPDNAVYAVRGRSDFGSVDVRVLELGEGS